MEENKDLEKTEATEKPEKVKKVKEEVVELTPEQHMAELVPFYAIKDGERYKDDIVVTINGKAWQIQRGQNVMIPRYVAAAIMDSERQKGVASTTSQNFEDEFKLYSKQNLL